MSYQYWWNDTSTSTTTPSDWYSRGWRSSDSTAYYHLYQPPRRILVIHPEMWTDGDVIAFIDLVNNNTTTGWIVTMKIKGEVLIVDPNIETRTMEEFIPLLSWRASREDAAKIRMFFEEHPITDEDSIQHGKP